MDNDRNIVLQSLDFFGQLPPDAASGLLSWTVGIIALTAIIATFKSAWPISQRVYTIPLAFFGVAWLSHLWIEADWVWADWIQVLFIVSTLISIGWNAVNLVRYILGK